MPREAEPSINAREFILNALQEHIRIDGRAFDQYRDVALNLGESFGQASVTLGKTRITVQISADIIKPYEDRKFDGVFTISTELSPLASPAFEVGRQDRTELLLSRLLEKTIRRSGALDTESLCIVAGQKCFHVRADVHVTDHDGNLVDACCIALLAALMHFRRPDFEVQGEQVKIFSLDERDGVKLSMQHQPFCITFSHFHKGTLMLLDASLIEEQCREGEIVVSMNRFGEICQIAKYGGQPVEGLDVLACTSKALEKVKTFDGLVKSVLEQDDKRRNAGGLMAELSAENERPRDTATSRRRLIDPLGKQQSTLSSTQRDMFITNNSSTHNLRKPSHGIFGGLSMPISSPTYLLATSSLRHPSSTRSRLSSPIVRYALE